MLDIIETLNESCNDPQSQTEINCKLYIVGSVLKEGTKRTYQEPVIYEILTEKSARSFLLESAKKTLAYLKDMDFFEINEVEEAGESIVRYISIPHLSDLDNWQNPQTLDNSPSAHTVLNREDFKPKAYLCRIVVDGSQFTLLKSISEAALLKKHTGFLRFSDRGAYELDTDANRRLFIDEHWDALVSEGYVTLINEKKVLEMFRYYEKVKEAAKETIERIGNLDLISDLTSLVHYVDERVLIQKKLARASNKTIDEESKQRMIELIQNGTINLRLNEENKIVCNSPQEMKIVVEVLLDIYVESLITKRKYKAHNKSDL